MQTTTRPLRTHLAKLFGTLVLLGLLLALTSALVLAAAPPLGIPGPNGEVIGLDYLAAHTTPTTADPRSGLVNCSSIVCVVLSGTSSASNSAHHSAAWTDAELSKLAGYHQIGLVGR